MATVALATVSLLAACGRRARGLPTLRRLGCVELHRHHRFAGSVAALAREQGVELDARSSVRAYLDGERVEFPLATALGDAAVLYPPTKGFVILNADGDEIGSTYGA